MFFIPGERPLDVLSKNIIFLPVEVSELRL